MLAVFPNRQGPMDDRDLPDPTYGYFVIFENPPPHASNLPDTRTAIDAIVEARIIARDCAATVHLRHHTETATFDLGSATPDGVFHVAPQLQEGDVLIPQDLDFLQRQQQEGDPRHPDLIPLSPSGAPAPADPPRPALCLDESLRNVPVTWPAGGPRPAPPPNPNATVTVISGVRLPFGPGSGRIFGSPR
ncbi:hypothetical protein CHT98_32355 (plasmid) [Azospirillum brasilense]|uniref:Uncharacterized protein n=2 Tax=Azospirillum brasilense TaxID=192 RepID=A0A235H2Z7_AZOBR|nr:hypothetical protein CHT98_32355 [Azospirillum brasilense]